MILRSPKFGNTRTIAIQTLVRRNVGSEIKVAFDPNWPKTEAFKMTFEALKTAQKDAVINFLIQNQGQVIEFVDFENQTWVGVISSKRVDIVDVRGDGCTFELTLEFQGNVQ
jgi:hypothetical protein